MMHKVFWGYLAAVTILVVPFTSSLSVLNVRPDVYLIGIFFACSWFRGGWSFCYAMVCGLLKASLTGHGMSGTILAAVLWWAVLVLLARKITMEQTTVKSAVMAGMLFLQSFVVRPLVYQGKALPLGILLRTAFLELVFTTLLFYGLLRLLDGFSPVIHKEREEEVDLEASFEADPEE